MSSIDMLTDTVREGLQSSDTVQASGPPREADPVVRAGPGTEVGRYLLLETLGQGGMAVVYLAHDPNLHRHVAIKLLRSRSGRGSAEDQARLIREGQALAQLSHPNLVQVYDVGTWQDQVFIAMEYVRGPSLQAWLRQPHPWRVAVQRLRDAGEGLVAAHRMGLVHRDFKPANVLVGDDGRVRVADFGLARLAAEVRRSGRVAARKLEEPASDSLRASMTESGTVMGTPAYMAPEQHLGEAIDARCDQYAFCVTLYEAVYGRRPFEGVALAQLCAAKSEGPPAPIAGRPVPAWLRRVIGRGLAPDPSARFPSMAALLRQLELGLSGRWRRLGVAALLVGLGAAVGLGYTASQPAAVPRCDTDPPQRWDEAERRAVTRAFERVGVGHGDEVLQIVVARLDAHAETWRTMHREACEATHLRGEQSDELLDLRMACLRRRDSELSAVVSLLAEADPDVIDHAVEIAAQLTPVQTCADAEGLRARVPPPEAPRVREQVDALQMRIDHAKTLVAAGRYALAIDEAREVVEQARPLGYAPLLSEALAMHGSALESEDPKAAEQRLRESITTAAEGKDDLQQAMVWTDLLYNVGVVQARHDEAISLAVGAQAALRRAGEPTTVLAELEATMGTIEWRRGRFEEATARYQRAQEVITEHHGSDDPRLRTIINNYGVVMMSVGRLDEAYEQFERGLAHAQEAFGPQHPYVADSLLNLGLVHAERFEGDAARRYLERALAILQAVPNQNRRRIAQVHSNLAVAALQQGQLDDARRFAEQALGELRAIHGDEHPVVAAPIDGLGQIALSEGDFAMAREHFERAAGILERSLGAEHPSYAMVSANLGLVQLEQGQAQEASTRLAQARDVLRGAVAETHYNYLAAVGGWAEAELALGRPETAIASLEPVVAAIELDTARARYEHALARALHQAGRDPARVQQLARRALASYEALGLSYWRDRVQAWLDELDARPG